MPGAGKQSAEVQQHIKELLEAGFDPTTIHRRLKVGRSSIYRMKRCLQQHGTAYMPPELNKKNGRPKVLTAEQELEVREWLRDPKNRHRYLDDLVWLIHDRFGIVCSTTTMSKMKRKWLRVIESEESGVPLDEATRELVRETHPDLPILQLSPDELEQQHLHQGHDQPMPIPAAQMVQQQAQQGIAAEEALHQAAQQHHQRRQSHHDQHDPQLHSQQQDPILDSRLQQHHGLHAQQDPLIDSRLLASSMGMQTTDPQLHHPSHSQVSLDVGQQYPPPPLYSPTKIDARLERQIQQDLAGAGSENDV